MVELSWLRCYQVHEIQQMLKIKDARTRMMDHLLTWTPSQAIFFVSTYKKLSAVFELPFKCHPCDSVYHGIR